MISCFQLAADRRAARGANETSTKTLGRIQGACGAERCFGESLKRWFHSFVNLASQQSCHLHPQEKSNQIWLKAWQYATWVLKQICPENLGFKVTNANTVHKLVEVRLRGGTRCNLIYQLMEHFKTRMHPEKPFYNYSQRTAASYPIILEGLFSIQRGNEKVYISDWKKSTVHLKKKTYTHPKTTLSLPCFSLNPGTRWKTDGASGKTDWGLGDRKGRRLEGKGWFWFYAPNTDASLSGKPVSFQLAGVHEEDSSVTLYGRDAPEGEPSGSRTDGVSRRATLPCPCVKSGTVIFNLLDRCKRRVMD